MKSNHQSNSNRALGLIAAALLTTAVAGGVWAASETTGSNWGHGGMMGGHAGMMQQGGMMGGGMPMMGRGGHMGGMGAMAGGVSIEATEALLAETRNELGITAAQESAWTRYADARLAQAGMMSAHHALMSDGSAQDLDAQARNSMMESGRNQMQALAQATDELYAVLTPEQASKARSVLRGPMHR